MNTLGLVGPMATYSDVADFMGVEVIDELTDIQVETLIRRASDYIISLIWRNYRPDYNRHIEACRLACCAQVQNLIETGKNAVSNDGSVASYSLGELSVTYAQSMVPGDPTKLCVFSRMYLNSEYLLYKGMG